MEGLGLLLKKTASKNMYPFRSSLKANTQTNKQINKQTDFILLIYMSLEPTARRLAPLVLLAPLAILAPLVHIAACTYCVLYN